MHRAWRNQNPPFRYPFQVVRIVVKDPEEFEQALREFRRKVQEQGLVREMRRRSHYVPPAEARKIKSLRARRRRTRQVHTRLATTSSSPCHGEFARSAGGACQ